MVLICSVINHLLTVCKIPSLWINLDSLIIFFILSFSFPPICFLLFVFDNVTHHVVVDFVLVHFCLTQRTSYFLHFLLLRSSRILLILSPILIILYSKSIIISLLLSHGPISYLSISLSVQFSNLNILGCLLDIIYSRLWFIGSSISTRPC